MKGDQLTRIWMRIMYSELLRRETSSAFASSVLRISSERKYQVLLSNVKKLALL